MQNILHKFRAFLSEGLLIVILVLISVMLLTAFFIRHAQLANFAEILPAGSTHAFAVTNQKGFVPEILATPTENLDFLGRDLGFALIDDDKVTILELKSKRKAEQFLEGMLIEDEEFEKVASEYADHAVLCFTVSHPECFTFVDSFLIFSTEEKALEKIAAVQDGAEKVEATSAYQNAKGRLPYVSDAFAYVDLQAARMDLVNYLGDFGFYEPGYLESILRIFPAFATSVEFKDGEWSAETFTAIDKEVLAGEGFFEHDEKYRHDLLKYTPDESFLFEWGGHDLTAQLNRIRELLQILNPSAATVFQSGVTGLAEELFGATVPIQDLGQLLDSEYYLGWTPGEDFLFLLELDSPEEVDQAAFLKDFFLQNYRYQKKNTLASGEIRAELRPLDAYVDKHADMPFYRMAVDGETVLELGITEDLVLLSGSEQTFFTAVDKIQTGQNFRMIDAYGSLLSGADELNILNLNFFEEGHILKALLGDFEKIAFSRKIFDDGIFGRYTLKLSSTTE